MKDYRNRGNVLDRQTDFLNGLDLKHTNRTCKTNLSKKRMVLLKNLVENPEILIKRGDKGGALIIMSANWRMKITKKH